MRFVSLISASLKRTLQFNSRTSHTMAPTQHKALLIEVKQGSMATRTIDTPKPGPGSVLIKVQSVGLNPLDWKIHKFALYRETFPAIIGCDVAGDVVELGEGVTNFAVGDRVFTQGALSNEGGAFQQYAVEQTDLLAKIPAGWSYDSVATLNISLMAAYLGMFNKKPNGLQIPNPLALGRGKSAGETIVVIGGFGAVGQHVIQLAKFSGFSKIIATAEPENADAVKSLGATHVISRFLSNDAIAAEVLKINDGKQTKYVFDAISAPPTQILAYGLLAPVGDMVILSKDAVTNKVEGKDVNYVRSFIHSPENYEAALILFNNFTTLLESGVIKTMRTEVLPNGLAGIPGGLERIEKNEVSGFKLIAHPQETP